MATSLLEADSTPFLLCALHSVRMHFRSTSKGSIRGFKSHHLIRIECQLADACSYAGRAFTLQKSHFDFLLEYQEMIYN